MRCAAVWPCDYFSTHVTNLNTNSRLMMRFRNATASVRGFVRKLGLQAPEALQQKKKKKSHKRTRAGSLETMRALGTSSPISLPGQVRECTQRHSPLPSTYTRTQHRSAV